MEFNPSGMLICSPIKAEIHPYALKPFVNLLGQPLYIKHVDVISRDVVLPRELWIIEAKDLAAQINENR
jgi:hypothetical protein